MNATAAKPSPGFARAPDYRVELEPTPRRLRVVFNGETVADTTRGMLMYETRHLPAYYFPLDDIRMDLMTPTDNATHCPFKGDASYWTLKVGDREAENALWSYEAPFVEVPFLQGYGAFYWDRVDHWYEEDEEIFVHPRDPYKRIDAIPSSREVRVVVGGETVAQSARGHFLFETNMPTRYYLPRADVEMELLAPTERRTSCPYKGDASYYSVRIGSQVFEDVVWTYPDPVRESAPIKDYLCFYNDRVDAVEVDGTPIAKPAGK